MRLEIDYNIVPGRRMSRDRKRRCYTPPGSLTSAFEDVRQYEIDGITVTQRQNAGRITGISWARDGYEISAVFNAARNEHGRRAGRGVCDEYAGRAGGVEGIAL